jgi:two-component system cell cycle sensor histidine kinase/response regulator CckA
MRALVVEDDALVRHLITRVIAGRGHEVVAVGDAAAALEKHKQEPFPLLVVDWVLPGTDGLELCRKVRALPRGDDVVILLVTARDQPADRDRALEWGASDYLAKPIDPATLQTRLVVAERAVRAADNRRQSAEALAESEAQQRSIVEAAVDGIITYNERGELLSMNPAALQMFGYESEASFKARRIGDLLPRDDDRASRPWERTNPRIQRPKRVMEMIAQRADGAPLPVEVSMSVVELKNGPLFTLIVRDLRERKEIENRLLLADRMATVGTLAAGIAHEINNPLAYVVANLGVLHEDLKALSKEEPSELIERSLESLEEAQEGAERVRDIVRDLRTFSRPDDRKIGPVDIHAALESALSMAAKEIRHRARVVRDFDTGLPPALANEARLGQVFLNLLVNAAQAISDEGTATHEIRVRTHREQAWVVVEVSDTGDGIPEHVRARIFDPFFTTKKVGEGTGLGLSICHGIITRLGGEISVESEKGQGTRFTVKLPSAPDVSTFEEKQPGEPQEESGRARILVIDDERFVARALSRALRDHDVTVVESGREALLRLDDETYDLVFCDLIMPELSGMDLFAEVQRAHPAYAERFVFMTGGAYTREAQQFLADLKNRWIEKPFAARQLKTIVSDELRRRAH